MPVDKAKLTSRVTMFTKKDFEDGKCTKEGFPIEKGTATETEPLPEVQAESTPEPTVSEPDTATDVIPPNDQNDNPKEELEDGNPSNID